MVPRGAWLVIVGVMGFSGLGMSCESPHTERKQQNSHVSPRPLQDVLKDHTDRLMTIPGVIGTAQALCDEEPCMKVYVTRKTPELLQQIPTQLEGYRVEIQEIGDIQAF